MQLLKTNVDWPFFDYDEELEFQVKYINDDETKRIGNKSKRPKWDKHRKTEEVDYQALRRNAVREGLVSWRKKKADGSNVKPNRSDLKKLLEPGSHIKLEPGEKMEDEIDITSPEVLEFLVGGMHYQFSEFIFAATRDVEAFLEAEKAKEKQNLSPGSPGPKIPDDSTKSK